MNHKTGMHPEISFMTLGEGTDKTQRSTKTLDVILDSLSDDKAFEIIVIDLAGKTQIADYMVIASGRSARHVGAIADHVVRRLKETGAGRARIEGLPQCDWVLIDAIDVIAHVFRPEVRQFYNLEKMWTESHLSDDMIVSAPEVDTPTDTQ
ncbi:MAG: ribosome silencing factor [Parvularculales bacterium]